MTGKLVLSALCLSTLLALPGCSDSSDSASLVTDATPAVTLANLNILHGFDCDPPVPADGDQCRIRERIKLLSKHLVHRGCPDLVALQEIVNLEYLLRSPTEQVGPLESIVDLISAELTSLEAQCNFRYELIYQPFLNVFTAETDEELVLSRYPVVETGTRQLHSALYNNDLMLFVRHVLHVRIAHPAGDVDVYTTHLASGSDSATNPCDSRYVLPGTQIELMSSCPSECDSRDTVRACQAEQLALYVEQTRDQDNLALIAGDFNAVPGSSEYLTMSRRGWIDTYLAAGEKECDSATGAGCTSGRASSTASLEDPGLQVKRRIDYIFAAMPGNSDTCMATAAGDTGNWQQTSGTLFAATPNPFVDTCGSLPKDICWVSNHSGNLSQLACRR